MAVIICYPTPNALVPGNGGFYVWGQLTGGDTVTGAQATWVDPPGTVDGATAPAPAPQCQWGYMFAGVAVGPTITVKVQPAVGNQASVTFTCVAHGGGK
jgi:hypothetical protein